MLFHYHHDQSKVSSPALSRLLSLYRISASLKAIAGPEYCFGGGGFVGDVQLDELDIFALMGKGDVHGMTRVVYEYPLTLTLE